MSVVQQNRVFGQFDRMMIRQFDRIVRQYQAVSPLEVFGIRTVASGEGLLQFVTVEIPLLRVENLSLNLY